MMTDTLPLFLVFAAGLLSFLSPCVLPLIPSYFSILAGIGLAAKPEESSAGQKPALRRSRLMRAAAGVVLGFSAVFITLGILVSATFSLMGGVSTYINIAAGIIVIVLGLNVIFDFLSILNYENRPLLRKFALRLNKTNTAPGLFAAFFAGAAFGAGWTPCIGPVLTGILLMAGQSGQTARAVFYLALYSAGLALPFLLTALFFDFFLKHTKRLRAHLPLIRRISGILLIVIGIMILTGRYSAQNILIQKWIFRYINWAEAKALPFRLFADFLAWLQNF
jgi:cytochrome c-type biogenesis protein